MNEVWKKVSGFDTYYVSNTGRLVKHFLNHKVERDTNKEKVHLTEKGNSQNIRLDYLVANEFLGRTNERYVYHKDGNVLNCNADNLSIETVMHRTEEPEPLQGEEWKEVPFDSDYMVSNLGRVFGPRNRIMIPAPSKLGYMQLNIHGKTYTVHQLVMWSFVGNCPEGMEVDHINRDKSDNRLSNLHYVSHSDNMLNRDGWAKDGVLDKLQKV